MDFWASLNIFLYFFPFSFFVSKIIRIFADALWRKLNSDGSEGCGANNIVG